MESRSNSAIDDHRRHETGRIVNAHWIDLVLERRACRLLCELVDEVQREVPASRSVGNMLNDGSAHRAVPIGVLVAIHRTVVCILIRIGPEVVLACCGKDQRVRSGKEQFVRAKRFLLCETVELGQLREPAVRPLVYLGCYGHRLGVPSMGVSADVAVDEATVPIPHEHVLDGQDAATTGVQAHPRVEHCVRLAASRVLLGLVETKLRDQSLRDLRLDLVVKPVVILVEFANQLLRHGLGE